MHKFALGLTTLLLGVVALAGAIIPSILFDVPPPWRLYDPKLNEPRVEGQKTVEWKGVKVAWGGKAVKEEPKTDEIRMSSAKWTAVAVAIISLIGLSLGPLAWWRERRYVLAVPGMCMCCAALTWQYLLLGIAVGAAAAVFLWVLSLLPSSVSVC
ncbi:MAG: hypothetical protein ACJ8FY_06435 [Gemmataceae bacterium]